MAMTNDLMEVGPYTRLYVIGDVHGRLDLLERMIQKIHRDVEEHHTRDSLIVTLGDYIDRGPQSREVIERLTQNPFAMPYVPLRGNHEASLGEFLRDPATMEQWRHFGGLETLHSYGVPIDQLMIGKGFDRAANDLLSSIPEHHFLYLSSLKLSISFRNFFLCHAGVRPGVPLDKQRPEDLLGIRSTFLRSKLDFGKIIIHGHTPREWPEVLPNRINIDTGAYLTGRLTCLIIEGDCHRFLFTD